jgi:hypothetical protein
VILSMHSSPARVFDNLADEYICTMPRVPVFLNRRQGAALLDIGQADSRQLSAIRQHTLPRVKQCVAVSRRAPSRPSVTKSHRRLQPQVETAGSTGSRRVHAQWVRPNGRGQIVRPSRNVMLLRCAGALQLLNMVLIACQRERDCGDFATSVAKPRHRFWVESKKFGETLPEKPTRS